MQIGIKLDIDYATSEAYQRLYGRHAVLSYLRGLGVQAVETPVAPGLGDDRVLQHARRCHEAGLRLSLHPYTEGTECNPALFSATGGNACRDYHEGLLAVAGELAAQQEGMTVVNIHPAAGPRETGRGELVEQTVRFFNWAREWCQANARRVLPVIELQIRPNPDEPIQRVGDSYPELLELATSTGCGICWDFGHAYMNAKRFDMPLDPPEQLLTRIRHVHCHDANDEDHQPLVLGNVPWSRWLHGLMEVGFTGTVILEVPPTSFLKAGGIETLAGSVHALTPTK